MKTARTLWLTGVVTTFVILALIWYVNQPKQSDNVTARPISQDEIPKKLDEAFAALSENKDSQVSKIMYLQILKSDPGNPYALNNMAYLLLEEGCDKAGRSGWDKTRLEAALKLLRAAIPESEQKKIAKGCVGLVFLPPDNASVVGGLDMMFEAVQPGDDVGLKPEIEANIKRVEYHLEVLAR
jgi:Tetratricopeptide repeat